MNDDLHGMTEHVLHPRGAFSLEEAATFGFGGREATTFDGVMRMAFCVDGDGYSRQAGVAVRQDTDGSVRCDITGDADGETVLCQVARVLSLDHDGREFEALGQRDAVIAQLMAVAPGLRPPLFYSPYEAALWSVLSARRPAKMMAAVRRALSETHGTTFQIAGEPLAAVPTPEALLAVGEFPGIPDIKLNRMHGIARAALAGELDCARLRAMEPDEAIRDLQRLDGIGPFYASLIVIRGTGFTDVLPDNEPKALALVGRLYGLGRPATPPEMAEIAERWRPFRTWATVLIRAAGPRLAPA